MAMSMGSGSGPKSDINMTPMIDVLLVLIIIFMVITPLTPKGLEALIPQPPPKDSKPTPADQRTVVVTINKDHSMDDQHRTHRREPTAAAPRRYFQDARRTHHVRQGRSGYRV